MPYGNALRAAARCVRSCGRQAEFLLQHLFDNITSNISGCIHFACLGLFITSEVFLWPVMFSAKRQQIPHHQQNEHQTHDQTAYPLSPIAAEAAFHSEQYAAASHCFYCYCYNPCRCTSSAFSTSACYHSYVSIFCVLLDVCAAGMCSQMSQSMPWCGMKQLKPWDQLHPRTACSC